MKYASRWLWLALFAGVTAHGIVAEAQARAPHHAAASTGALAGAWRYEGVGGVRGDVTFTDAREGEGYAYTSTLQSTQCLACEGCECRNPVVRERGWYVVMGDRLELHATERVTTSVVTAAGGRVAGAPVETRAAVQETRAYRVERGRLLGRRSGLRDVPDVALAQRGDGVWLFRIVSG